MPRILRLALLPAWLLLACPPAARAETPAETSDCNAAIRAAEREEELPRGLLAAMARVESGRRTAQGGIAPWPWTINAQGEGRAFETQNEALRAVRRLQAEGTRLIDVGCLQVNLHHHPQAFASLEEAFSPTANARYAARFLRQLRERTGDWMRAVAHYHSAEAERGGAYRQRVLLALQGAPPPPGLAGAMRPPSAPPLLHLPILHHPGQGETQLWLRSAGPLPRLMRR